MKVCLEVNINPVKKLSVYPSLERAEEFLMRLLASDEAKRLAKECRVELPIYEQIAPKLHRGLGFARQSNGDHVFCCWEQEAGGLPQKTAEFDDLTPTAIASGKAADTVGGQRREEQAGIHLVYRDGELVKTFWLETCRR